MNETDADAACQANVEADLAAKRVRPAAFAPSAE